ncbi:50S ribosomal protein L10, partial [Candidatus Gottesmanbacteria bacterium RBG_13_37_7]
MTKDTKKISANREVKIESVRKLSEKLEKAKSFFLTDYRGLTHKEMETLRKALKKEKAEFMVVKNRLMKIALSKCSNETMIQCYKEAKKQFEDTLTNPTA